MEQSDYGFAASEDLHGQKFHQQQRFNSSECDDNVVHEDSACTGCGARISDQYYLSAIGRRWHVTCLRCCACQKQLDPVVTCFINGGNIYCEFDFRRLFMSRDCVGCLEPILPEDMVMRIPNVDCAGDKPGSHVIYHARCFTCVRCDSGRALSAGEHYGMQDGRVYCRAHYCEVQLERRQAAAVATWESGATVTPPTGRRTGMRGRPRKLRPAATVRPPTTVENHSPRLCTENPAVTSADTDPSDHCSERMSSDVSDDAIHDDANSSNGGGGGSSNGAWDDTATGNGVTRRKRMRSSFKHHQLKIMKSYFQTNHNPDAKELREIALKTGLMTRVIQVWFQNARAKFRRNLSKQQQQQQILGYVSDQHPMTSSSAPPWTSQHHLAAEPDDDDDRRHVTDRDFRYCRRYAGDVIGAFDRAVTQCRDCCSVEMAYAADAPSQLPHYQQIYQ